MNVIKPTTWLEVFENWREREGNDPAWIHCATKTKGWPDWESWRRHTAEQLGAPGLEWQIAEFEDPANEIPEMLVGPFGAWQERVKKKNLNSFSEMLDDPKQLKFFNDHQKVLDMMYRFPAPTQLIGIIREDLNKIVCIEGHHRVAAVALAQKLGHQMEFRGKVEIAIAKIPLENVDIFDKVLERGTQFKAEVVDD